MNYSGEIDPWTGTGNPYADSTAGLVTITSAFNVTTADYTLTGKIASGVTALTVALGGQTAFSVTFNAGTFTVPLTLSPGHNTVHLAATDAKGVHPRYNPVVTYDIGGASSARLIDEAEASGAITAEEALTYRVFAAYGDPRLPDAYRGNDSLARYENTLDAVAAAAQAGTLSEAAMDTLGPFLVPDYYVAAPGTRTRALEVPRVFCNPLRSMDCVIGGSWANIPRDHVVVWYDTTNPDDKAKAELVADVLDPSAGGISAWYKLQGVMHVTPPRLDIVLTAMGGGGDARPVAAFPFRTVQSFIRLERTLSNDALAGVAVHELMHAFQFARGLPTYANAYGALTEGTADWAISYVLPRNPTTYWHVSSYFDEPNRKLTSPQKGPDDVFPYGTWMFFFYLSQTNDPEIIGTLWDEAAKTTDQVEIIKSALATRGKDLTEVWHDWAIYFWNGGPEQEDARHDLALYAGIQQHPKPRLDLDPFPAAADIEYPMQTTDLPALAVEYYRFDFSSDVSRSLLLLDGWTNVLGKESMLRLGDGRSIEGPVVYPPTDAALTQGARMQVITSIDGRSETVNFSEERVGGGAHLWHYQSFCRDLSQQRLERMVVALSYADVSSRDKTYAPPGDPPRLTGSNIFCGKVRATANLSTTTEGVFEQSSLSQFDYEGHDHGLPSLAHPGGFVIYGRAFTLQSGTVNSWSLSGTSNVTHCSFDGQWSGPVNPTAAAGLTVYSFSTDFSRRAYQLPGFTAPFTTAYMQVTCPTGDGGTETKDVETQTVGWGFKAFGSPPPFNLDTAYFTIDGSILEGDDSSLYDGGVSSGRWMIRNMPE